jgi:sulfite reductase alpha subunit-like flavoprotein
MEIDHAYEKVEIIILYGTQTGNSLEIAEDLGREGIKRNFAVKVVDISKFNVLELPQKRLIIFVCSTAGQGEFPSNMKEFWRFLLRKNLPSHSLQSLQFAVFGLGDSSYAKYNYVSKMLFNRLKQLGGTELLRRGDGNDQHPFGFYGDFVPWSEELWRLLLVKHPLPNGFNIENNTKPLAKYKLLYQKSTPLVEKEPLNNWIPLSYNEANPYIAKVRSNERITSNEWEQDVRHIVIEIDSSHITYNTGDVVYIKPINPISQVEKFINFFGLSADQLIYSIQKENPQYSDLNISFPISVFDLCKNYFDFLGIPNRYFFELLSHFATKTREIDQLKHLSSAQGYELLYEYSRKAKRNYLDIFVDFPSAKPPLEYFFDLIKPIKARPFSISSSQKLFPSEIHVSLAVVKYISPIRIKKYGLCSNFLANLEIKNGQPLPSLQIWVSPGSVKFPTSLNVPLIMVGPGTGCAMFRSFIQENYWRQREGQAIYDAHFFFGCRHKDSDYLYQNEWQQYLLSGALSNLFVAFSRDQAKKNYVQHELEKQSKLIWRLINDEKAVFIISGKADKMPKDVRASLLKIICEQSNVTKEAAEKFISVMEQQNRYLTEVW